MTDINKFDKQTLQSYWDFVEKLAYDCINQNAYFAKVDIMKRLSPSLAEKYKEITDALAFSLYREVFSDKKNNYLYACYDAISKGSRFYEDCWLKPEIVTPLASRLNADIIAEHNFSNVFPVEDEFYVKCEDILDTCVYDINENIKNDSRSDKFNWQDEFESEDEEF